MYKCFDCSSHRLQEISPGLSTALLWLVAWVQLGLWLVSGLPGVRSVVAGGISLICELVIFSIHITHDTHMASIRRHGHQAPDISDNTSDIVPVTKRSLWHLVLIIRLIPGDNILYCKQMERERDWVCDLWIMNDVVVCKLDNIMIKLYVNNNNNSIKV